MIMKSNISPDELLTELLKNASTRKAKSLEVIHTVCKDQYERGSKDFSIPTIARLLIELKGPSEQTIRNPTGEDYRGLISCWANHTGGSLRKPTRPKDTTIKDEILSYLTDPTARALVGAILTENTKLKGEVTALKSASFLSTDLRGESPKVLSQANVEVLPSYSDLTPTEREALRHAISDEFLREQGWTADEQGRIKYKGKQQIFKIGFIIAIKKVLNAVNNNSKQLTSKLS